MIISQFIGFGIAASLGLLMNLSSINPNLVKTNQYAQLGGYLHNDIPKFNDRETKQNEFTKTHLKLGTEWRFMNFLQFNIAMQGFGTEKGFTNGVLGGLWGVSSDLTDYITCGYEHWSGHIGDNGNGLTANAGSYDYIFISVHTKKIDNEGSLLGMILK